MSDKNTKLTQYLAQGGKDGDSKETVTRTANPEPERTSNIQPAPPVK